MRISAFLMASYFLIGSFFPKTDFGQFMLLPELIEHYYLHLENEHTDIGSFVYDHLFQSEQHEHEEGANHNRLPLHSIGTFVLSNFSIIYFQVNQPEGIGKRVLPPVANGSSLLFCHSIFHPPSS